MKDKDYLHSDLLSKKCNNEVFQQTYEVVRQLSWEMLKVYSSAVDLSPRQREEYLDVFTPYVAKHVVDLVNLTIDKFEK